MMRLPQRSWPQKDHVHIFLSYNTISFFYKKFHSKYAKLLASCTFKAQKSHFSSGFQEISNNAIGKSAYKITYNLNSVTWF